MSERDGLSAITRASHEVWDSIEAGPDSEDEEEVPWSLILGLNWGRRERKEREVEKRKKGHGSRGGRGGGPAGGADWVRGGAAPAHRRPDAAPSRAFGAGGVREELVEEEELLDLSLDTATEGEA